MRDPIDIMIQTIEPNGEMKLLFSEELFSIKHYEARGINLTVFNQIKQFVLEMEYTTHVRDVKEEKMPQLAAWNVTEFTRYGIKIQLNFTNVLYVSSAPEKDTLRVKIVNPAFFKATRDSLLIAEKYKTEGYTLPSLARSEEEFETLESIGSQAESSMLITLIVPFCFMVFMSVSMNRVWSLYLML